MANDSSLQGSAAQFAFDFDSQKGVTQLLASVRASNINTDQKNELRDLIFLYANGGRDQSVRLTLEQKIFTYNIVPIIVETKASTKETVRPKLVFGTSRPSPSFVPAKNSVEKTATPITTEKPIKQEEVIVPEIVLPDNKSVDVINPIPPLEVPIVEPAPVVEPVSSQLKPEPEPEPEIVVPQVQSELPPEPVQVPEQAVSYDPNQALIRIREIKSLVNDRVGNPVNLVDINNEVGREYMGALLDAMKKLNSGTSTISAMKRLETAFALVEKTINEHDKKSVVKESENSSELITEDYVKNVPAPAVTNNDVVPLPQVPEVKEDIVPTPVPVVEETSSVTSTNIASVNDTERTIPIVPTNNFTPIPTNTPVETPTPSEPTSSYPNNLPITESEDKREVSSNFSVVPRPEPAPQEVKPEAIKAFSEEKKEEEPVEGGVVSAWGADTDTVIHDNKPSEGKVSSLSQSKIKPRTINELPLASSLETSSVSGDPLYTKQVDDGLEQLLLEWSLFKKSGLFGTGPKGRQHPLFLKMVGLQIPLLLAGRFEGATQEIKQSITDYMNGWRYEQGIVYEQGETFEHYLRRVIRHILDLQKK